MGFLWVLLVILSRSPSPVAVENIEYRNTPLKSSSGVYYEYLNQIQLTAGNWRILTFVQVNKLHEALKGHQAQFKNLPEYCKPILGFECKKTLG